MNINEIKQLQSLDLEPFEIRGAKAGVSNARSTGPVYVSGTYDLPTSKYHAIGTFTTGSPSITGIVFSAPYSGYDCNILKVDDIITVGSSSLVIKTVDSVSSITLTANYTGSSGPISMVIGLTQREYLVEPDVIDNTIDRGTATFQKNSGYVVGLGTDWTGTSPIVSVGDFIQHNGRQQYYKVDNIISGDILQLDTPYEGDDTNGAYTIKKWSIGSTKIEYTKNDFTYDKNTAQWKFQSITGDGIPTSTSPSDLADGIKVAFTRTISSGAPDLMDSAVVMDKIFAQKTQTDAFQFSLPVVPNPESSMDLYLNEGLLIPNKDYAINYHQSPIYLPPSTVKQVANIMPLANAENVEIPRSMTENGQIHFVNSAGVPVSGVMPGTEHIAINSVDQTAYKDYMVNIYAGTAEIIGGSVNEELVKYIAVNKSNLIDIGLKVYMNGIPQQVSYPSQNSDDVMVSQSGGLRIKGKDHPGPNEWYEIHYQVTGSPVYNELSTIISDSSSTYCQSNYYPLMNDTVIATKNGVLVTEWVDYRVSYPTGRITFLTPLATNDSITLNYVPLSVQVNSLSYSDGTSFCTVYDSRMIIVNAEKFELMIINSALKTENLTIQRVYNETRDKEYSLVNITASGHSVVLQKNAINEAIGLAATDNLVIDYYFVSEIVEYQPIVWNRLTTPAQVDYMYFSGTNVVSEFPPNSIVRLVPPDEALPFYSSIVSSAYDGEGTIVNLASTVTTDFVNPFIAVTDGPVTFSVVPYTAGNIISGSSDIFFSNVRIRNLFRAGVLIRLGSDIYQVEKAGYDDIRLGTTVKISGTFIKDYLSITVYASDNPVYAEGSKELVPFMDIVDTMSQPGIILSGIKADIQTDSTSLQIITDSTTYQFFSANYSDCTGMVTAIKSSVPNISAVTYVPYWDSTKIIPGQIYPISEDFPATISVGTALRLGGVDTSNFSANTSGGITLEEGLVKGQRYNLDYMGREYLGDSTVVYSASYFSIFPKGSKIQASFKFDNLDQFYIQVMSQRDFLNLVTIPRMKEEGLQLNGNPGQGGEISDDAPQGNDQGGMTGDEYRRQDMAIECDIFKKIYDWFSDRLEAFGTEMYSATGLKIFNNDGIFNETEQEAATLSFNRIFPSSDYTNFEPMHVNPLTGEYYSYGAEFVQGNNNVNNTYGSFFGYPSYWTKQLKDDDFIRRADSTRMYKIASIISDTQLTLDSTFEERSTYPVQFFGMPDTHFAASSKYPIFDDNGYLGPKIVGTRSGYFGLVSGDIFDYYIDGVYYNPTITLPSDPFMMLLFPSTNLSADSIAKMISNSTNGLIATAEWVFDTNTAYGYKTVIVLRTNSTHSILKLGPSTTPNSAIVKLGFLNDSVACGNFNPLRSGPEIALTASEMGYLGDEIPSLNYLISIGAVNKLNRYVSPFDLFSESIHTNAISELSLIPSEIIKIDSQIASELHILEEPSGPLNPSYLNTSIAYTKALDMRNDSTIGTVFAGVYDSTFTSNWQGRLDRTSWVLDFQNHDRYVRGRNSSGIGVPSSSGTGIISIDGEVSFVIDSSAGYDRRILLNAVVNMTSRYPTIVYEDNLQPVSGTWTGGDPSVGNIYTMDKDATFNFNFSTAAFSIGSDGIVVTNRSYSVDKTAINIFWTQDTTNNSQVFRYANYTTIGSVRLGIDAITGFSTVGSPVMDPKNSESFLLSSGTIAPSATIYPALRPCYVTWQSISDQMLDNRLAFATDRSGYIRDRNIYLSSSREPQIMDHVATEEILRQSDGNTGDLYTWANNRWNRRQGCNAKLVQIGKQIEANGSAAQINKGFI